MPGRRILVVEDDADNRAALRALLETWGHAVEEAADGEAGLRLVLSGQPDLLLVDISMPGGMDGLEVARRLRATPGGGRLYLIALTGRGGEDITTDLRVSGFDAHLLKPCDPNLLNELISAAGPRGAGRHTLNE